MVMSDRIALLRSGQLEQVAPPDEIYNRPATSYTAEFIGHTNLLRADVKNGTAHSGSIFWTTSLPDGNTLFSLRPERIRPAGTNPNTAKFRARVTDHSFHGASELVHVKPVGTGAMGRAEQESTFDDQTLTVRSVQGAMLRGKIELEFDPEDAVPVRESEK